MYDVLRTDILDLKLRPGLVFSIKDVCDAYGTGRTPVREALIRLSKEGLITFCRRRERWYRRSISGGPTMNVF